jgi:hypothetical protein
MRTNMNPSLRETLMAPTQRGIGTRSYPQTAEILCGE